MVYTHFLILKHKLGFKKIEGLDTWKECKCLYLQENCFEKIEGLDQ